MTPSRCTAIVIGGGISGIKAAADLTKANISTFLLEGRDRLGGRLLTDRNGSLVFDKGASWFHDTLSNPIFEKIVAAGTEPWYFDDGKCLTVTSAGILNANDKIDPVFDEVLAYLDLRASFSSDDISLRNAVREYLYKQRKVLTDTQLKFAPQAVRLFELWIGQSWNTLSAVLGNDFKAERNAYAIGGYDKIWQREAEDIPKDNILLNTVVTKVEETSSGLVVSCNDGKKWICDYLVVTVPLSLLKLEPGNVGAIEWDESTKRLLDSATSKLSFAALGKVYLEFDHAFWPKDADRFFCLGDPDIDLFDNVKHNVVPRNLPQVPPTDEPKSWDYPVAFLNGHRLGGKPVLIALTQSPVTDFIEADPEARAWKYLKPMVSALSGLSVVPDPKLIQASQWTRDPFARGSYTGQEAGDDYSGIHIFEKGAGKIRFAGEHTVIEGGGCVHGAWKSGEREAKYIIEEMKSMKRD